jgi:hypothetical protein
MVASHAYLESRWCTDIELPTFLARRFGQRIFCVKMRPIRPDDLPAQLHDVLGFDFWEEEPGGYRTLGEPVPKAHEDVKFYDMIRRLGRQLGGLICKLRDRTQPHANEKASLVVAAQGVRGPQQDQSMVANCREPTAFLADASDDLETVRDGVEQYLRQFRVQVLCSADFPADVAGHHSALRDALVPGVVFVQLLSRVPGRRLGGDRLAQSQHRVSRDLGRRVLQWRDPALLRLEEVSDANHRALLETAAAIGIEEFKSSVLQAVRTEAQQAPVSEQDLSRTVFINCV